MRSVKAVRVWIILSLLALALAGTGRSLAAPPQQEQVWVVTYPGEGAAVNGEVTIQGTATHSNFGSYGVLYAPGPRPTGDSKWVPIVFGATTMVVNGPLATWNTTQLPNGQYTLALAVYEVGNDTPFLHFVNNITVYNEAATPTPTETPSPTPGAEGEQPTIEAGPIAAPTIQQPPTATPAPATPTPSGGGPQTPEDEDQELLPEDLFEGTAIREAFTSGVWIAVMLYLIGGLYLAARAVLRYYLRQQKHRRA